MGTIIIDNGGVVVGCTDPLASNYNPNATEPCGGDNSCCFYNLFSIVGCTDPLASNYDPNATTSCNGCCEYSILGGGLRTGEVTVGCKDPAALNYDVNAFTSCPGNTCCLYPVLGGGLGTVTVGCKDPAALNYDVNAFTSCPGNFCCLYGIGTGGGNDTNCPGPFSITIEGLVQGVNSVECCNGRVIGGGLPPAGYEYYWDGSRCYYREIIVCPTDLTCLNCNNLNWWNNTYITHHNGQSLQISNPVLWTKIIDLVTNSGQTFYVQTSTGNLIDANCCGQANGIFIDGLCSCDKPAVVTYTPKCISNITEFLQLISTPQGQVFFNANFTNIGISIGLTSQQITFILTNLSPTNETVNSAQATLILANQLIITGGFYVNFSDVTGFPATLTSVDCTKTNGYWDGYACKCKPPVSDCKIDLTMVQTVTIKDFYNNNIQIVTLKDPINDTAQPVSISEACCNKLIKDYSLPWEFQGSYCYATPKDDCLPVIFNLNNNPMKVEPCDNNLELSMWVYFGKPSNACQPIPDPPDVIVIDGVFCDVTISPNTGTLSTPITGFTVDVGGGLDVGTVSVGCKDPAALNYDPTAVVACPGNTCCLYQLSGGLGTGTVDTGPFGSLDFGGGLSFGSGTVDTLGRTVGSTISGIDPNNNGNVPVNPVTPSATTCCYNNLNPILARVTTTNPLLNGSLIQIKEYNSVVDLFDRWIEIKAQLPMSGLTLNFGLNLEIYQGLNCCCNYDIFVDDIKVTCSDQEPVLIVNDIQCPGFDLNRVIDNKKSWVYNPGTPEVGISDYDIIERGDGSFGTLNGEGIINRTFAPSLDADIPWRYTDYFVQSSVYERHSNLVLNSKELFLTFNMCATDKPCPVDYTFSANTKTCYKVNCPSGTTFNSLSGSCTDGVDYYPVDSIDYVEANRFACTTPFTLLELENYKKTFQSFWLQFMEQFIPATTIWVAAEKWCNKPEDDCVMIDPCDYDYELIDSEVIVQSVPSGFFTPPPRVVGSVVGTVSTIPSTTTSTVSSGTISGAILETGTAILTGPVILVPIVDYGSTTITTLIPSTDTFNIDFQTYQDKFTETTTLIVGP